MSSPAFARVGSKLYVVGGGFAREVMDKSRNYFFTSPEFIPGDGQFIVLDLSVPWDQSTPAWKRLQNGPKQMDFTAALTGDGSKLVTFNSGANQSFAMLYDVANNVWSPSKVNVSNPNRAGISGVTDPSTNRVYLPIGYDNSDKGAQMFIYHFDNDTMTQLPMTSSPLSRSLYFDAIWWSKKKSILYFGGNVYPSDEHAPNTIIMYTPSTNYWLPLATTGTAPSGRREMCTAI
ncbi:hypothetical protein BGZ65_008332, partial [Modicella reniformis]